MSNTNDESKLEREKEAYQQLVVTSCEHLLPILTPFKTFESAPHHTLYHLSLIVDATLKSFSIKYRTDDFFQPQDRHFNIKQIEEKIVLKDINAEQTSRLKKLFNQFIVYVTQQLNWRSTHELTDQLVLPKVLPVIREKQMFNLALAKHYHQIITDLSHKLQTLPPPELIGLVSLSAIFDSNQLHISFIEKIVRTDASNLKWLTDDHPVLDIGNSDNSHPIRLHNRTLVILLELFRRKINSPLTFDDETKSFQKAVQNLCQQYLKSQPISLADLKLPSRMNPIIEIAGADYFLHRPAFFHAAMTQKLQQTPLSLSTKLRVITGQPVKRTKPIKVLQNGQSSKLSISLITKLNQHECLDDNTQDASLTIKPLSWQLHTIKHCLKTLTGMTKQKAIKYLQDQLENPQPERSLMSLWLLAWLQNLYIGRDNHEINRKAKKHLKQNSILRYFSTVYRHVLPVFDNIDVADLEEDEWIELLQECIDHSHDSQLFKPLNQYIKFLTTHFNIPALPLQDLEGGESFSNVNANLITPYEVDEILGQLLVETDQHTSRLRMQACALILGFFCGLRRKEVLGLRVIDLYGHDDRPFLFLRSHKNRGLKNAYSRRRLDLVDFIPKPYLMLLMAWHRHQSSLNMKFLMSFSELEIGDDKRIIDPVQDYCRQITGDETFVFHGLRHSFANLFLIRILQIRHPRLRKWLGNSKENSITNSVHRQNLNDFYSIERAKSFLSKYFPTENTVLPRSTLLQLAHLLGHKVPDTTSRSYLHLIEEIDAEYYTAIKGELKESLINQYWTFSKAYQRSRFKKNLLNPDGQISDMKLLNAMYEKLLNLKTTLSLDEQIITKTALTIEGSTQQNEIMQPWLNPVLVENIYPIYKQLFIQNTSIDDIAAAFSISRQEIQRIKKNALEIANICTSKGKKRFEHPFLLRRSNELEKQLSKLMKKISKLEIDYERIKPGINLYLHASQAKNAHRVMLTNLKEFEDYIQLLNALKLPFSQIGLRIYPGNVIHKSENELNTYWSAAFQNSSQSKTKPISIKLLSAISTKQPFGQVEVEPIKHLNNKCALLEHYQFAIHLLAILTLSRDDVLNKIADGPENE
jgi:integrase